MLLWHAPAMCVCECVHARLKRVDSHATCDLARVNAGLRMTVTNEEELLRL